MKNSILASLIAVGLLILACSDSGTGPAEPTISVADDVVEEGVTLGFVVTLNQTLAEDVSFSYATSNGSAIAGSDYTAASGIDTIPAGMTSVTVGVNTTDDAIVEANESLTLTISSPVNASIADGTAIGTITDNDGGLTVSFVNHVRPLLVTRCATAGCHGTGSSQGGLTMGSVTYNSIRNGVGNNGAIVVPSNSASSNLYLKTTINPPFGGRMPATGAFLNVTEQDILKDWIDQGANNN